MFKKAFNSLRDRCLPARINKYSFPSLAPCRKSGSKLPPKATTRDGDGSSKTLISGKAAVSIVISKWTTGWGTICSIYLLYLLALGLGLTHFLLFRYLDGKLAGKNDEFSCSGILDCVKENARSQAYTSAASILLSNAFSIVIRMSLAIAFTQHLWKILRNSSMKVDTIEELFNLRSNFLTLFYPSVIGRAWVLVLMAALLYLIPVATSFPPGALTVESKNFMVTKEAMVPTFNASYNGDGSVDDVTNSLIPNLDIALTNNETVPDFSELDIPLQRLATNILLAGTSLTSQSPCGPNCSYTLEFEGPTFKCDNYTTVRTVRLQFYLPLITLFHGQWTPSDVGPNSSTMSLSILKNISTSPRALNGTGIYTITSLNMDCVPFRTAYILNNSYNNSIQTTDYAYTDLAPLTDVKFPLTVATNQDNFSGSIFATYRDWQLMGITSYISWLLNGSCQAFVYATNITGYMQSSDLACNVLGPSLLPYTQFLGGLQTNLRYDYGNVTFDITEDSLNQLLRNFTVSLIPYLGRWNQTTNVTQTLSQNVYSFSQPLNLILPYSLSLLLVLPFLIIGTISLIQNGVPAADGGFVQILSTTTGSRSLQRAAAGNCLAGGGHPSEQLRELKIRYGELVDLKVGVGGTVIRRAGFGVENEVATLQKGYRYGVVGKIDPANKQ